MNKVSCANARANVPLLIFEILFPTKDDAISSRLENIGFSANKKILILRRMSNIGPYLVQMSFCTQFALRWEEATRIIVSEEQEAEMIILGEGA